MERRLWSQLRLLELPGGHFRRQAPVGPYFADFAHFATRTIVEVDGDQHGRPAGQRHDAIRTRYLQTQGFFVQRFANYEVRENLDGVVETIFLAIAERSTGQIALTSSETTETIGARSC